MINDEKQILGIFFGNSGSNNNICPKSVFLDNISHSNWWGKWNIFLEG